VRANQGTPRDWSRVRIPLLRMRLQRCRRRWAIRRARSPEPPAHRMSRRAGLTAFWLAIVDQHVVARSRRRAALVHRARLSRPKHEIGLGHYEGCGWWGFHHLRTLSIAAYGLLICERKRILLRHDIPPIEPKKSELPGSYRPRGTSRSGRCAPPHSSQQLATTLHRCHFAPAAFRATGDAMYDAPC
jgi:hypothetical protein